MTNEKQADRLLRQFNEARAMRIDHDLVRLILLEAEGTQPVDLSAYTKEQIAYHMSLLICGDYASGLPFQFADGSHARFTGLTWKGHEFLDNARNDIIWNRAKAHIAEHGGSVSLEVLSAILAQIALKELEVK